MEADGFVTILELRRKTRLPQSGVCKILAVLKTAGKIRRIGPDRGGHWEVIG